MKQTPSNPQITKSNAFKENLFALVILILVIGSLGLSITDKEFRPTFADLAKVGVGGFIGWMMPGSKSGDDAQSIAEEE
ncbi:MAG: hypothetical protein F6K36_16945 [Symploca sp. SIO3C6]|nr:hypothetical protein [Symploca sp. SIO3C6]